jgi:oligopeptide/dipeptide ABC transporter ATP-binding protein
MNEPLLEVQDLRVVFHTPLGDTRAVWGVSFQIEKGHIFGIVGESGCGKSATGRAILRLVPPPGEIVGGQILFHGQDLLQKSEREMAQLRGRRIAMVFQDPSAALNPLFTLGEQLMGIMRHHRVAQANTLRERSIGLLADLGLPNPDKLLNSYPHQLSGGMQQRAMIAMALSTEPDLIIADEPTSCLDVTIQSQILDLLVKQSRERDVAVMLITHDLGVVAETCEQVAVFYLGQIVEQGSVRDVYRQTKHPYTMGLLAALPNPKGSGEALKVIPGSVPSAIKPIPGCVFASRCEYVMDVCREVPPNLVRVGESHLAACYLCSELPRTANGVPR